MAAEAITPVDEIGMPLPLAPYERGFIYANQPEKDEHHLFHPRKSPTLVRDLGGRAVRVVRLQQADWHQHHIDYHGYYYGPPLPETSGEQFGIVVLAIAGYVPDRAISFYDGEPEEVPLTHRQRQQLWEGGDFRTSSPDIVRNFLTDYTTKQSLTDVDERLIDEFLNTPNMQKRHHLGGVLLGLAIERATEPIDPFYRQAWKKGLIHRNSSHRIQRLIKKKLQYKHRHSLLIDKLEDALSAA